MWASNITPRNIRPDEIAGDRRLAVPAGNAPEAVCRRKCRVREHRLTIAFFKGS